MTETPAAKPKNYRLKPARFTEQHTGFQSAVWRAVVENETPYDEILKPDFWAHIAEARQIRIGDEIIVMPDNVSFRAHLFVLSAGRNFIKVAQIGKTDFAENQAGPAAENSEYRAEFKGPHHKWSVVRIADNEIIKSGFKTAEDAKREAGSFAKAMAA